MAVVIRISRKIVEGRKLLGYVANCRINMPREIAAVQNNCSCFILRNNLSKYLFLKPFDAANGRCPSQGVQRRQCAILSATRLKKDLIRGSLNSHLFPKPYGAGLSELESQRQTQLARLSRMDCDAVWHNRAGGRHLIILCIRDIIVLAIEKI